MTKLSTYKYDHRGMGFGKKSDFTDQKHIEYIPGPVYDHHTTNSISYISNHIPKTKNGFYSGFDAYEKICYPGMEQFFYGKES